ncbi:cornichon family protein [Schizosaccharomyces octosporus yFS286]|uniref:Cornichon family protein n=1 Tax=Schizosaccharomyces octosporus (strain yFS286) TaxID=483514 RepID=S9PTJ2_SCHOY|nr:cornichon family protein [Schizosaccharomyces octosporus yFS286]EPX70823.1 cornichon family protein [Schizosaccharomyces octosporus yFS286]
MTSPWIYFTSLMMTCASIMLHMYFTVMYSDLKDDFINPIDLSRKLNYYVIPEMMLHAISSVLLLFSGAWVCFIFNLPMMLWNVQLYLTHNHLHDSTTIFKDVSNRQKRSFIKLAWFSILFFTYLFMFVSRLVD